MSYYPEDEEGFEGNPLPEGWEGTKHELFEGAHLATRAAWLWPEDDRQRIAAIEVSAACGVDYIDRLASLMESTGADMPTARRFVAEAFRVRADEIYVEDLKGGRKYK